MDGLFRFARINQLNPLRRSQLLLDEERPPTPRPLEPQQPRQIGRPNITVLPPIKNPPITIRTTNFNTRVPLPPISNGGRRRSKKSDTTKKSKTKSKSKSRSRISMKRKNKNHNYRKSRK
jgi:hypothetical protein